MPSKFSHSVEIFFPLRFYVKSFLFCRKWKVPCITSDWVFDCIEKGHCLPTDDYRVDNLNPREKVSTPEKTDVTMAKLQEVSMCSTILHPNDQTTTTKTVNETQGNSVEKREIFTFLPLRFYVKSILGILEVQKLPLLQF